MLKCNILKESEAVDDYLDYLDRKDEERFERMSPEAYERYRKEQQRKSELIQKKWREETVPRLRETSKQKGFDRSVFPKNIRALDYSERSAFFDRYMDGYRGYTLVRLNGKWNIVDRYDNVLFDTWFDNLTVPKRNANSQNKNFIRVKLNNKYNYIKIVTRGKKIVYLSDIWFDYADDFRDDWGYVKINRNDNEYLWIDTNGELFYDDGTPYEPSSQENHNEIQNNVTNEAKSMSKKNTIRLTESELKNIIVESVKKIIKEDCDNIESQFSDWALNGSKTSHSGFNAMGELYEYYYEDDDNALYNVAEEFSNEFGCDIEEVYEVARKFANQYFYYNPVDMGDEGEEVMESCTKLNEIGDTPRGQYAMGAVQGRNKTRAEQARQNGNQQQYWNLRDKNDMIQDKIDKQRRDIESTQNSGSQFTGNDMKNAEYAGYRYGLKRGMTESCNQLHENDNHIPNDQRCYQMAEDLLEVMEPISLIAKLGSRMGFFAMRKYLESIARIELSDNYGEDEEL